MRRDPGKRASALVLLEVGIRQRVLWEFLSRQFYRPVKQLKMEDCKRVSFQALVSVIVVVVAVAATVFPGLICIKP